MSTFSQAHPAWMPGTLQYGLFRLTSFNGAHSGVTLSAEEYRAFEQWYMTERDKPMPHVGRYARAFPTVQAMVKAVLTGAIPVDGHYHMADTAGLRQLASAVDDWLVQNAIPVIPFACNTAAYYFQPKTCE